MAYVRKTYDEYQIQTNYGEGWNVESRYGTYREAKQDFLEYQRLVSHYGGEAKIVKRRIRNEG